MTRPLVSCIVPCYNSRRYLRDAIDSVLSQTYDNIELIAVDDGSTDDTVEILKSYGSQIRIVQQQNAGTGAARNSGAAASSGVYLAWLDSDDAWLPQKIADQVDALESYPELGLVYTKCQAMDESGNPPSPPSKFESVQAAPCPSILRMFVVESEVMPSSCLLRKRSFDDVGGYDTAYRFSEDWEFDFRFAQKSRFGYIDFPLTRYRVHDESKSKDRWPHALGRIKLRHKIEGARQTLCALDPSPEMMAAYAKHRIKYADAYYRIGKLSLDAGDTVSANKALKEAIRLNPRVVKYYTRLLRARAIDVMSFGKTSAGPNEEVEWCSR